MEQKQISTCPVCHSNHQERFKSLKDHMVTQEEFTIMTCTDCGFHFTSPIPNEEEIVRYYQSEDYISHSSTNKGLINWLYNQVRAYTLKKKTKMLVDLGTEKRLLEIGSGTGHFLNACQNQGFEVLGLEPDDGAKAFAKENFKLELKPLDYLREIEAESKDLITMWHVLEHVYHLERDLKRIVEVLHPDGILIIAVPNLESYDAGIYQEYWAAYDVPRHLYHFRKKDIENLAQKHGLILEKVLPMKFDSFYVSMLSEKYKKGSVLRGVWNGLKSNLKARTGGYSSQTYILRKKQD